MANQHSSVWVQNPKYEDLLLHLRENEDMDWPDVADAMGLTKYQVRKKYRRLKKAGEVAIDPELFDADYFDGVLPVDYGVSEDEEVGEHEPYEVTDPYREQDYLYADGVYTFTINSRHYSFDEDTWQEIVTDYSDHGGKLTRQELAIKYGGNYKVISAALRKYGAFKASPPATREEIADVELGEGDYEPLMDRAVEAAQRKFQTKLTRHKFKAMERDYAALRKEAHERGELVDEFRTILKEMQENLPAASPKVLKEVSLNTGKTFHVFAPIFDCHIGIDTRAERGWTTDYDVDTAVLYIEKHAEDTVRQIKERNLSGSVESAIMALGGDIFHTIMGKTLSGRDIPHDSRGDRILMRIAVKAFIDWIETVRPYVPEVVVKGIDGGNHDGPLGGVLVDFLSMYFRDADDVLVDDAPKARSHFLIGDTLHVIDHGMAFRNVTGNKSLVLAERVAKRTAGPDYYKARRIVIYVGHMHHREGAKTVDLSKTSESTNKTQGHIEIIRVPVFVSASDYEETLGFWNEQMSDSFHLTERGRIKTIERLYAEELDIPKGLKEPQYEAGQWLL